MIVQTTDVVNRGVPPPEGLNTIEFPPPARFLNDRTLRIPPYQMQPVLGGALHGRREVYILHLKISPSTGFRTLRLRILNGSVLSASREASRRSRDEVSVDVASAAGRALSVCFECNPAYGSWILAFGTEGGWDACPLHCEFMALIRTSEPRGEHSIGLPRFVTGIRSRTEPIGEDRRGSVGQPYGRTIRQLRTYQVEFQRVRSAAIEDYYGRVSTTIPHFVVPFPEDVEHVPPIWATLREPPEFRKRDVNGWYWNCRLSWREAY